MVTRRSFLRHSLLKVNSLCYSFQKAKSPVISPRAESTPSSCVTLCAGVAAHIAQLGEAPETLVAAADQALYQAKVTGRNGVVLA